MSGFKLYEIDQFLQDALDARLKQAEDNEGVYDDDFDRFIEDIAGERSQKLLDCARYVKALEAQGEAVKAEKVALAKRQATYEGHAKRMTAYIANHVQPGEKIEDANTRLGWRKSSSVEILVGAKIPECYTRIEIIPDKTALKKAIVAGEQIPGVSIVEKQSLQIK